VKKDKSGTIIGTTKKAPYGYGYCNVCRAKNVHLSADGMLAGHGVVNMSGTCSGSGKAPGHAPEKFKIVLAWVSPDLEIVSPGRIDLGERPVLKQVLVPRAAMWLKRGTDEDLEKAKAYAKAQKGEYVFVFTYLASEKDPIGRAKKEAKEILVKYGSTSG
jgi:hypothetical protein